MERRMIRRFLFRGAVLLSLAETAAIIKLNQPDVQRIEAQTGKPVEEMSDDEIKAAIQRLGIKNQKVTLEDQAHVQGSAAPAGPAGAEAPEGGQRFCPGCGAPANPGARFCEKCGEELG